MMKKLLVLALVLSMATLANAALTLTIDGPAVLDPGMVGTYTIGYTGEASGPLGGYDLDIISDQGAQPFGIDGGVILTPTAARDTGADIVGINTLSGNYEVSAESFTLATPVAMASPLFTINFTAGAPNTLVGISLINNGAFDTMANDIFGEVDASFVKQVQITPEPMTLGLLALGGLFIRRK
jgi:hypothetical protein